MSELKVRHSGAWISVNQGSTGPQGPRGNSPALNISTKTTSYSVTGSDDVILMNGATASCFLPTASGNTGKFYVISNLNATPLSVSVTGSTPSFSWATAAHNGGATMQWVSYGSGSFVLVGNSGTAGYSSNGGYSWTGSALPVSQNWHAGAYGGTGLFVSLPYLTGTAAYSVDGSSWTVNAISTARNIACEWIPGASKFLSSSYNGISGLYSSDGITWTPNTTPYTGSWYWSGVSDTTMVALRSSTPNFIYSTNGTSWSTATASFTFSAGQICGSPTKGFVSVQNVATPTAAWSATGAVWQQVVMPVSSTWSSVVFVDNYFLALPSSGVTAAYSSNGVNWTSTVMPFAYASGFGRGGGLNAVFASSSLSYILRASASFPAVKTLNQNESVTVISDGSSWRIIRN